MIIPGVQKPHWRAWHSWKAAWTLCSCPLDPAVAASPSMVVTSCPLACTASTLHDFTLRPSRCTVPAPQLLVSQPITVPVLPSFSRRYWTSSIRCSTSSETRSPSTVSSILDMGALLGCQASVTPLTLGVAGWPKVGPVFPVSYTHLRAHETDSYLVCRLLLEKK